MAKKYVYFFGNGKAEGKGTMKDLLGGKGAGLAEMTNTGVPVPAGFTITTEACNYYSSHNKKLPSEVTTQMNQAIAKLEKGQKIELEAYARLGLGMNHAKWQAVGTCAFSYLPIINIDYDKCTVCGICAGECPHNLIHIEDERIFIENILDCSLCKICEKVCEEEAIKIDWNKNNCIFKVESSGALPPERIVIEAANILKNKGKELLEKLDDLENL